MAFADTQKLIVELNLAGNFTRQLSVVQRGLGKLDARLSQTEGRAFRAGQQIGTGLRNSARLAAGGIAVLGSQVIFGLKQLAELESLAAQTNAVLESTGGVAGQTGEDIRRLAEKYENLNATIDDKVIQSGENLLLTFTNIRKEAFEPALEAALNMSTALDQDLNTSVLQLGKALNDPVRGLTALRRVGVQFTEDQEKLIKSLVKEGKILEAQQVILKELGTEFGGSFAAGGKTAQGAVAGIGDAVEDLQKALATSLFPTIQKVLPRIREFLTSPAFVKGAEDLGKSIASLFTDENIQAGVSALKGFFETAKSVAPAIGEAAKITAEVVKTAVGLFNSLPPEIQKLAIGAFAINKITGGLVTNIAGGLISSVLKQLVSGVVNVNGGVVNVNGAGGLGGAGPTGGTGLGSKIAAGATAAAGAAVIVTAEQVSKGVQSGFAQAIGGSPLEVEIAGRLPAGLNLSGPLDRITRALSGDFRSELEVIQDLERQTGAGVRTLGAGLGTKLERQQQTAAQLLASSERADSNATIRAAQIKAQLAAGDTRTELAVTGSKAAITAGLRDTRAETAAVRAAVDRKDLSVTVNTNVNTNVSVNQFNKAFNTYKSIYKVAS